jgi:hypothetical protein
MGSFVGGIIVVFTSTIADICFLSLQAKIGKIYNTIASSSNRCGSDNINVH